MTVPAESIGKGNRNPRANVRKEGDSSLQGLPQSRRVRTRPRCIQLRYIARQTPTSKKKIRRWSREGGKDRRKKRGR